MEFSLTPSTGLGICRVHAAGHSVIVVYLKFSGSGNNRYAFISLYFNTGRLLINR
jgi:hypothetical protein